MLCLEYIPLTNHNQVTSASLTVFDTELTRLSIKYTMCQMTERDISMEKLEVHSGDIGDQLNWTKV